VTPNSFLCYQRSTEEKKVKEYEIKIAGRDKSSDNGKAVNILILDNIDNTKNMEIDEAISEH